MTILETLPILEQAGNYDNAVLLSLIIAIACLFSGIGLLNEKYEIIGNFLMLLSIIGLIIFTICLFLGINEPKTDTGRVKYIIQLDDNYPVNEFYDKYKVLEHTKYTNVYTVEEIND